MSATAKYYCFTWNNYTAEEFNYLLTLTAVMINYIVFGKETAPTTGTPHLQGYVEFTKKIGIVGAKKILDPIKGSKSSVSLMIRCAKDRNDCIKYCKKGEQTHAEWDELKDTGPNFGKNADFKEIIHNPLQQGKRTDKTQPAFDLWDAIKENPDAHAIMEDFAYECMKHSSGVKWMIDVAKHHNRQKAMKLEYNNFVARPWQERLIKELDQPTHPRKIIWYVDKCGDSGKSYLTKYLAVNKNAIAFSNGSTVNIAHIYNYEPIVIFDFPRTVIEHLNYEVIEALKNGMLMSGKYDGKIKIFPHPHIVVFANFQPNRQAMSADRWDVRYLNKNAETIIVDHIDNDTDDTDIKEINL